MTKYYTTAISKHVPEHMTKVLQKLSQYIEQHGYVLRTNSKDDLFYKALADKTNAEFITQDNIPENAYNIASEHHTYWFKLKPYVKNLTTNNVQKVFGQNLHKPCDFVLICDYEGKGEGYIKHTTRIAQSNFVPVYDLGLVSMNALMEVIND